MIHPQLWSESWYGFWKICNGNPDSMGVHVCAESCESVLCAFDFDEVFVSACVLSWVEICACVWPWRLPRLRWRSLMRHMGDHLGAGESRVPLSVVSLDRTHSRSAKTNSANTCVLRATDCRSSYVKSSDETSPSSPTSHSAQRFAVRIQYTFKHVSALSPRCTRSRLTLQCGGRTSRMVTSQVRLPIRSEAKLVLTEARVVIILAGAGGLATGEDELEGKLHQPQH